MAIDTNKCNSDITNTVKSLASSQIGEGHDQFLIGIRVAFDLTFTNKAWVELERYRFAILRVTVKDYLKIIRIILR